MNSYELSRSWFDYCFTNPDKIKPNHTAVYFFAIEHCNRLGWKEKFGFPTTMVMEALGIKSYNTYINTLTDLVDWKFIIMIEKSKNQYSANIIALSNFNKALDKALDKALIKHGTKQCESMVQSIDSIIKQVNNKQYNNKQLLKLNEFLNKHLNDGKDIIGQIKDLDFETLFMQLGISPQLIEKYKSEFIQKVELSEEEQSFSKVKTWLTNWLKLQPKHNLEYLTEQEIQQRGLNPKRKYIYSKIDGMDYCGLLNEQEIQQRGLDINRVYSYKGSIII